MRVLLTGGTGLLGWEILANLPDKWQVFVAVNDDIGVSEWPAGITAVRADLNDAEQIRVLVYAAQPDCVIHLASHGSLDFCEAHPEEARQLNIEATRELVSASRPWDPFFVLASTMYVFNGEGPPYGEEDQPSPINEYGRTKVEAERIVLNSGLAAAVLRPMTLYGWHRPEQRKNWATWLIDRLGRRQMVNVVDDVLNNYLWVGDGARAFISAVEQRARGILHLGGPETLSRYDFSVRIAEAFEFDSELIRAVDSDFFPTLAPRPRDTTCSIDRLTKLGLEPLSVRAGLRTMRERQDQALRTIPPRGATLREADEQTAQ